MAAQDSASAPAYKIAPRNVYAVEHPMIVRNFHRGLQTFGTENPFEKIVKADEPLQCIPLWLRPGDPMCVPITSHNAMTDNVLVKVTVPKRTGRKRRRGTQDPFQSDNSAGDSHELERYESEGRRITPSRLLRTLKENPWRYTISAVGKIQHTQRFRVPADFQQSTSQTDFFPRFKETVLTGHVERIRNFQLNPSRGCKENDEIMPPPVFTPQSLPLVWNWEPDPPWEDEVLGHRATSASTKRPGRKNYNAKPLTSIHPDADCPTEISSSVPHGEVLQSMISTLEEAFSERPIWTRDALAARVSPSPNMPMLRKALQYVGYRFTAGPWRECLIKRGVDPRLDPSHRKYQTIYFRVHDDNVEQKRWYKATALDAYGHARSPFQTFDGKSFTPGNKIWQLCDVSDPLLARLITTAPFRDSCDNASDGWFTNGALAKIRSIMRTKLDAIQLRREVTDGEFAITLEAPDIVLGKRDHKEIIVPLPNIYPTDEEIFKMSERGIHLIRTGARKATIEKGALRSRNRVASRHIINTYEDSDEDLTAPYGLSPRLAHTSNSKAMGPANMIAGATTSDVDGGMGGNKQQKNAVIGNWLSDTHKGATTESFYGAEEIPSDSGRSAMESDEEAQSDPDIPADGY